MTNLSFLHFITELDKQILLFINASNTPFLDMLMTSISNKYLWIPLYLLLLIVITIRFKKLTPFIILIVILAIVLADQGSVIFFKNIFHRLRPCHNDELKHLLHLVNGKCGGRFGFISSHAANTTALTTTVVLLFGKKHKWLISIFILYTILNCYSRIYLGVHYPSDIVAGAIYGIISGYVAIKLFTCLFRIKISPN